MSAVDFWSHDFAEDQELGLQLSTAHSPFDLHPLSSDLPFARSIVLAVIAWIDWSCPLSRTASSNWLLLQPLARTPSWFLLLLHLTLDGGAATIAFTAGAAMRGTWEPRFASAAALLAAIRRFISGVTSWYL